MFSKNKKTSNDNQLVFDIVWQQLYLILSHELKRDNVCNVDSGPGQPQLTETKLVQPPVNLSPGKKMKGNGVNKGVGDLIRFCKKMREITFLISNIVFL